MARYTAIVLAAGQGRRMNSEVAKQYMTLNEKPVLYYSLRVFEDSDIDEIILVVGAGEEEYVREAVVERYSFKKVKQIIRGGQERYHSVYQGLLSSKGADYVLIHDAARPLITWEIIARTMEAVVEHKACVVGMPSKDTIKISDENNIVISTPKRENVWTIQTPQAFEYHMIIEAYQLLLKSEIIGITDDAMVVEQMMGYPIKLLKGSYTNIKITTPEDIILAEALMNQMPEIQRKMLDRKYEL